MGLLLCVMALLDIYCSDRYIETLDPSQRLPLLESKARLKVCFKLHVLACQAIGLTWLVGPPLASVVGLLTVGPLLAGPHSRPTAGSHGSLLAGQAKGAAARHRHLPSDLLPSPPLSAPLHTRPS